MSCTIQDGNQTVLFRASELARLLEEYLYVICDVYNSVSNGGCTKTTEELLPGVKTSVKHLHISGCEV